MPLEFHSDHHSHHVLSITEFGGPMISPNTHQPIGSCFVFRRGEQFPDVDAINAWIENDEYHKQKGEYDL